jgi:hypothetical protein
LKVATKMAVGTVTFHIYHWISLSLPGLAFRIIVFFFEISWITTCFVTLQINLWVCPN